MLKIKQCNRFHYMVIAAALSCTQSVSAQDEGKHPLRNSSTGDTTMKSENKNSAGLTVSSPGAISNTKSINVIGPVNMTSDKSITNGSQSVPASIKASSSVTLKAPMVHNSGTITAGSGNVNITTGNLVNSGSISAPSGDVTISSQGSLVIDNSKGSITGKNVKLKGGAIKAHSITLEDGDAKPTVDSKK